MLRPDQTFVPRQHAGTAAPTWVLLRGLIREHRHWGGFPQQLADRLGTRVVCPDLPGNGTRHTERSPWALGDNLTMLRRELDGLGPLNLLGLSMGGMIAAEWALRHPREVHGLVLINCSLRHLSPPWQRLRPGALGTLTRALFTGSAAREALIHRLTCARQEDRAGTLSDWRRFAAEHPVSRINCLRQTLAAARYHHGLDSPRMPALILCARGDRLVDPACSNAIARHWQTECVMHPWAGHDLPHDDAEWLLEVIGHWQQALSPGETVRKLG